MRKTALLLTIAALLGTAGCTTTPDPVGAAADALAQLEIKGRAPQTGYDREGKYGEAWIDVDGNGCDTRNDILQRDLDQVTVKDDDCTVTTGILDDPYSGKTIQFHRDGTPGAPDPDGDGIPGHSNAIQIEHTVALSDSWQKGAQQWDQDKRTQFANDPLNLLAVDGPTNSAKGDSDAATWLPPNKPYRCEYVARQVAVKVKYSIWVTQAEHDAIAGVLATCPGQTLPNAAENGYGDGITTPVPDPSTVDVGKGETVEPLPAGPTRYSTCKEAKAAGEGSYQKGIAPQYEWYTDGDGDGITCE